jgi:integrase/recombinase XerD
MFAWGCNSEPPHTDSLSQTMDRFAEFLKERVYLLNVSPTTVTYYQCAFKAWTRHASESKDPKQWIVNMRTAGLSAVSCNTYICAMNAYWKWAGEPHHLGYLKEEQKILATLTPAHISRLLQFRPKGRNMQRAHTLTLLLLDTGLRISEALGLAWDRVDLDNLVLRVLGKGGKHRVVPFSFECRKLLYRWRQQSTSDFVFPTSRLRKKGDSDVTGRETASSL